MSLLFQQLSKLKQNNIIRKIGPKTPDASILANSKETKNLSVEILYTMAIMSYSKIKCHLLPSCDEHAKEVLSQQNKQINRNKLTKEENNTLSLKIKKFLLYLTPFLNNLDCQKVIEYLYRNYKIYIFEAEILTIMFIHYWKYPVYQRICESVQINSQAFSFVKQIAKAEVTLSFIIKTILYNNSILQQIVMYLTQYSKLQSFSSEDIAVQIQLQNNNQYSHERQNLQIIRNQPKNFVYEIFRYIISNDLHIHYKTIIRFCLESVSKNINSSQLLSMVMLISTQMLFKKIINEKTLAILVTKLLKKVKLQKSQNLEIGIFNFVVMVWQRSKKSINIQIIQILNSNKNFITWVNNRKTNHCFFMIFRHLFECLIQGVNCLELLEAVSLRIKVQQFVLKYEDTFYNEIFKNYLNHQKQSKYDLSGIKTIIHKFFQYEFACFFNRNTQLYNVEQAKILFGKKKVNNKGIDITLIQKKLPSKIQPIKQKQIQQVQKNQQQSQQKDQKKTSPKITLLTHLKRKNVFVRKLQLKDQKTRIGAIQLVKQFYEAKNNQVQYEGQEIINSQQKNSLFDSQEMLKFYTDQMFKVDISNQDWTTPIKYVLYNQQNISLNIIELVLSAPIQNLNILSDILFKQLVRVTSNSLALKSQSQDYKCSMSILGRLYHRLLQILNIHNNLCYLKPINEYCLRISKNIFGLTGTSKGKFYKLVHSHSKMLALMIKNINQERNYDEVKKIYLDIVDIFGISNLYMINVGTIQLLTKNNMNSKEIKLFINVIIDLANQNEQNRQSKKTKSKPKQCFTIQNLNQSIIKTLALCDLILKEVNGKKVNEKKNLIEQEDQNQNILEWKRNYAGIAKKVLTNFYGLSNDKHKKSMVKKIILFLQCIYSNQKFIMIFQEYMKNLKKFPKKIKAIMSRYSEMYKMIKKLSNQDQSLQPKINRLIDYVINIFALEEKLVLFGGLLPDNKIYSIIGKQLINHSKFNSQELGYLMSIVPENITAQWVCFMSECMKRNNPITSVVLSEILKIENNSLEQLQQMSKFLCQVSLYNRETLLLFLDQTINIIKKTAEHSNDLSLALITNIIGNMGDLIEPYIQELFKIGIQIKSSFTNQFIEKVGETLTKPLLITVVKNTYKNVDNLINFSQFLKKVLSKNVKDTLFKTLMNFYSLSLKKYISEEINVEEIQQIQAQGFLQMVLTLKEDQLRKVLINFITWAQNTETIELQIPFGYRKTILLTVFHLVSQKLGSLFTSFFGYIFQNILKDLTIICSKFTLQQKPKSLKRARDFAQYQCKLTAYFIQKCLNSFQSLFNKDTQKDFLDSGKFDELCQPLTDLFLLTRLGSEYYQLMQKHLIPCILSLCCYIEDDYQLKTLCYKILLHLKNKNGQIEICIYTFFLNLIERIQDRSLIIVNDLGRFLAESLKSRNEKVQGLVRNIMYKIKELSGENLENYVA